MGMMKEFKQFAMRGNVIDMAIGIVLGAAFGKIIASFVTHVIMPPIGLLLGNVDFSVLAWTIKQGTETSEAVIIGYGLFINTIVQFVIVAFAIFMVVRQMNKLKKEEAEKPAEPPKPSDEVVLLTEIRDSLRK